MVPTIPKGSYSNQNGCDPTKIVVTNPHDFFSFFQKQDMIFSFPIFSFTKPRGFEKSNRKSTFQRNQSKDCPEFFENSKPKTVQIFITCNRSNPHHNQNAKS